MIWVGYIVDEETGQRVPGATVALRDGSRVVTQGSADNQGFFQLDPGTETVTNIFVSSVGYSGNSFNADGPTGANTLFPLKRAYRTEEEVTIFSPDKKKLGLLLLVAVAAIVLSSD